MRHLWLAILLVVAPSLAMGQDTLTLAKRPNSEQVATAKETIRSATQSPTAMAHGGYAVIDIKLEGKLTNYVVPGSDDCIKTISLPKGQGYSGWLVSKGETVHKWTEIAAITTHDRLLVTGTANGTTTLIWMTVQNGEAVVVAAFQFVVGKPQPPPPPPDEIPLIKSLRSAYQLDSVAGIGNREHLEKLEGVYAALSNADLSKITTQKQLTELMVNSVKGAGIPDYKASLTNTRKALQQEYLTRQGISDDSASDAKPINQTLVKQMFADFAAGLGALSP